MRRNRYNGINYAARQRALVIILLILAALFISLIVFIVKTVTGVDRGIEVVPAGPCTVENISVKFNRLENSNFTSRNGLKYYESEGVSSKAGIDVSFAQKDIDWHKVRESGIDFAMIRLGFRGYESGRLNLDEYFEKNMTGAASAGIGTGVYFFSQAVNEQEAIEEADFVIEHIKKFDVSYPVAFDWEIISGEKARTDNISQDVLNSCALAFCRRIEEAGYRPVIYASLNLLRDHFEKYDIDVISEYDLWLAEYKMHPEFPYRFSMWQYSDEGIINGINYETDINILFE